MSSRSSGRPSNAGGRSIHKRSAGKHPVYSGVPGSSVEKDIRYMCPVCSETIKEAYMTKCGHSFCRHCIETVLSSVNKCPKCSHRVEPSEVYPNFSLNEMIMQYSKEEEAKRIKRTTGADGIVASSTADANDLVNYILTSNPCVDLGHVDLLLELLQNKRKHLEFDTVMGQNALLAEFLTRLKAKKQEQFQQIGQEIRVITADLEKVNEAMEIHRQSAPNDSPKTAASTPSPLASPIAGLPGRSAASPIKRNGFGFNSRVATSTNETTVALRTQKLDQHSGDLQKHYFALRQQDLLKCDSGCSSALFQSKGAVCQAPGWEHDKMRLNYEGLDEFKESLAKFSKFSTFRPLASLNYTSDLNNISSIVSSIDFDRDSDFFAIAGVTKKIKVFEYSRVISDVVDTHYPVAEMVCNSKISCVAWSSYDKSRLASSDYEGTVTLWDAFAPQRTHVFQEHEKRAWCVDFNRVDPNLVASGSDDARVKLWSVNMHRSAASIEAKANVCCVQFNPKSRYHLAFGCADHCVHYYDLRSPKKALATFSGHRKAVSYAKFVSGSEIVSASTDSQLKMWSVTRPPPCVRTFTGHVNEKNFVGLATDGEYIACGSEDNKLCVYYKGLMRDLFSYKFEPMRSSLEKVGDGGAGSGGKDEDSGEFVSAVTWRPGYNVVVAANSQGVIKILELV